MAATFLERFDLDHTVLLQNTYTEIKQYVEDCGGCDHGVGICMCMEIGVLQNLALLFGEERVVGCVRCHEVFTSTEGHYCELDSYEEEKKAQAYSQEDYEISQFKQEVEGGYRQSLGYVV